MTSPALSVPVEIERKFLVASDDWRRDAPHGEAMVQGYLAGPPGARCSVRVRVAGERAFLNIKSLGTAIRRDEYEYAIPPDEARRMLETLADGVLAKRRHRVAVDGHVFEIDVFEGTNAGLVVAEIELTDEDAPFPRPPWLGREVSHLARYYNLNLVAHPYAEWSRAERMALDA